MPIYDFKCKKCDNQFEALIYNTEVKNTLCPKCGKISERIFPTKAARFNLKYNPKSDVCDWDGNTSQFYRLYNEAKDRGENVRLPEDGE